MSKSSPARRRYQAENYARRNASKLAAQAMHAAAVKRKQFGEALAELNRQAALGGTAFAELHETLAVLNDPDAMSAITEAEQENTA